jgi:riboflavin kinase/FMN adenylyltransferase
MQVLTHWQSFPPPPSQLRGGVLCVGNFDGVHLGHAHMLTTGRDEARRRGVPFVIMTFDPHPSVVLKPGTQRSPLTTVDQRLELLAAFSPDVVLLISTTPEFLSISAEDFLYRVVTGDGSTEHPGIGATCLVEGPTFTYGKGAKGTVETLKEAGPRIGLDVIILPTRQTVLTDLSVVNVSSTFIRWLVERGRVADAAKTLGRPYTLRGTVVQGQQRGRTIGFPTANLQSVQLLPAPGVYAGSASFERNGRIERHVAAISVGTNPTFQGQRTTVEAFLLDFEGDLYGLTMDLAFHGWVREMHTFAGVGPLVAQMNRDVALTRQLVSTSPASSQ